MEDEELQNTIDKINKIMKQLGSLNIYGNTSTSMGKMYCQKVVNKAYDDLFKLSKHLSFIQKKGEKNEKGG